MRRLASAVAAGDLGLPWAVQAEQVTRGDDTSTLSELLAESVDAVRSILGLEVRSIVARASGSPDDDHGVLAVTLTFDHQVGASITVSKIIAAGLDEARIRVMGNEGVLVADLARPAVLIDGGAELRGYGPTVASEPPERTAAEDEAIDRLLAAVRRSLAENAVIDCQPEGA